MKEVLVDIIYLDGTKNTVSNDVLDVLIATQKILRFKRCDGWVDIVHSRSSLRDYRSNEGYKGPERRASWPRIKSDI